MNQTELVIDQRWNELFELTTADKQTHLLLAECRLTRSSWSPRPARGRLEIEVSYFWGPLAHAIQHKVCSLGGRCEVGTIFVSLGDISVWPEQLRGQQIGTYFFDKVVEWAQTHDPALPVGQIWLAPIDAKSEENSARRFHFYKRFGLLFIDEPADGSPPQNTRSVRELTVGQLKRVSAKNLRQMHWSHAMRTVWLEAVIDRIDAKRSRETIQQMCSEHRESFDRLTSFWRVVFKFVNWLGYAVWFVAGLAVASGTSKILQLLSAG